MEMFHGEHPGRNAGEAPFAPKQSTEKAGMEEMPMRYIALFRGLNVGGKNRVQMAALGQMLRGLGLERVSTYIQSGNAVFDSQQQEAPLGEKIQAAFLDTFGFPSPVILRSAGELEALIHNVPFAPEEIAQARAEAAGTESLYCYLLTQPPSREQGEALLAAAALLGRDSLVIHGREIYLLCRQSIRLSKAAARVEKLPIPMTCRNVTTLGKLLDLAN